MSSQLLRQDLIPIGTGYLILMGVLAAGLLLLRRASKRSAAPATAEATDESGGKKPSRLAARLRPGWLKLAVQVGGTIVGGYVLLMAVDILYYYGVAKVAGQFLDSAVSGGALLIGISVPVFAAASWLTERRRRTRPPHGSGHASPTDAGN